MNFPSNNGSICSRELRIVFQTTHRTAVKGAIINLSDKSGSNYLNKKIIGNKDLTLKKYISSAKGGEPLDFKTNGIEDRPKGQSAGQYMYRGMSIDEIPGLTDKSGTAVIASARDIGNIGAGYVAGDNGLTWAQTRLAFDLLESTQQRSITVEGQATSFFSSIDVTSSTKTRIPGNRK